MTTALTVDAFVRSELGEDQLKDEEIVSRVISNLRATIAGDPEGDKSVGTEPESGDPVYEHEYLNLAATVAAAVRLDQVFGEGTGTEFIQSLLPSS